MYKFLIKNKNLYKDNTIEYKGNNINIEEYIDFIKNDGNYCGEFEKYITTKIFKISVYCYEFIESINGFRFLYHIKNEENFLPYCMILNHVYLNNRKFYASEHFELILINNINFDY